MVNKFEFREGNIDDIEAVFALNRRVFDEAWSKQQMLQSLQFGYDLWVCWAEGLLLGYVLSQDVLLEAQVMQIAVHPDYRRQGIAQCLMKNLIADKQGYELLQLEVRASNQGAQALYNHLGFRLVGRRPRYYSQTSSQAAEDALLFDLKLSGAPTC